MEIINPPEYLELFASRINASRYGVFGIFQDKTSSILSIGFGDEPHATLRRKMEHGREMIGGGAITGEKEGGFKIIGTVSNSVDYPPLSFDFMQSVIGDICRVLQTDDISVARMGDFARVKK